MAKQKKIDLKPLINSDVEEIRISTLFLKIQTYLLKNAISEEECKVLARMLNAYYND